MNRGIEVLKRTQDDWHGSYVLSGWYRGEENPMFVKVVFCGNISPPDSSPIWRTCVWGNDDLGMDFDCDNESEAFTKFLQVIGLKFVNLEDLTALGFVRA